MLLPTSVLILSLILSAPLFAANDTKSQNMFKSPDVLVLVLGGFGTYDQCSINYAGVVALPKAQADLDAIGAMGKWQVTNAQGETKSSGGPKPIPSTSISFQSKGIIGYANGTLPLEPFITALKRFKFIEIDYLVPADFQFHGLKDFENRFVNIKLSPTSNSYRYRVIVKDSGFSKLDLPVTESNKPIPSEKRGMPLGARIALAIGLGIIGAAVAYFITAYIQKRKNVD